MTREEYEQLLQSPYWKGYSYSLIKERNFTCQDCGRSFPNERNKLQVHHLVYRDVNPWSYNPDELLVLCEECHKKRHGIISETTPVEEPKAPEADNYTRSYSSDYNTSERDVRPKTHSYPTYYPRRRRKRTGLLAFVCLLAAILIFRNPEDKKGGGEKVSSAPAKTEVKNKQKKTSKASPVVNNKPANATQKKSASQVVAQEVALPNNPVENKAREIVVDANTEISSTDQAVVVESLDLPPTIDISEETYQEVASPTEQAQENNELTTLEILERKNHENAVEQAKRAGVSTEGTTLEILERINHANVVKTAERAGVSTEGTTVEILERINRANVIKQAQREGVSTEGSTSEILERITHASAVKQAQRAGVSTEGTTSEILERITHASAVKQAQRAGVSTEGTTSEILERITRKSLENSGY